MRPVRRVSAARTRRAGPVAVVLVLVALTGCGGSDAHGGVIGFDAERKLAPAAQRALDEVSGTASAVPAGITDVDVMGSMTTPWHDFADPATERRFDTELDAAKGAAQRYHDAAAAAADGYVLASYFIPEFGVHWINWSLVTRPFDPAHPTMLLYDNEGADAHLVGLSYYTRSVGAAPAGFTGDNDHWHRHFGACYSGGFIIGENVGSADECAKRCQARSTDAIKAPVGDESEIPEMNRYLRAHPRPLALPATCRLVPGDDVWMLHAWVVPGHADPDGLFSTVNPRLRRCVGTCRSS